MATMEIIIFWDVTHYSPVQVYRRFGGTSVNVYQNKWHYIRTALPKYVTEINKLTLVTAKSTVSAAATMAKSV
jgi:hypothetical protein